MRAEEAVRERDELLRVLTEHAREFIRLHDLDGRSVYASPSVERLHGRAPTMLFEFAHPEDVEGGQRWWQHVLDGGAERLDWRVRDANGDWRWLETSAALVRYHGRPHILTISRDSTERKQAEAIAKTNEERLRLAFEAAKIGTGEMDLETMQITLSEPMRRVVGLPPNVSTLSFDDWVGRIIHPDDRASVQQTTKEAIAGQPNIAFDYRIVWPDGTVRWANTRATVFYDQAGKATRIVGAIMDITDRKHLEDELRQAQKMEAIGHLAGGVAHDFNNLLTIIFGSSEMLLHGLPAADPARDLVSEIRQAGNRAAALTRQLLAFSRRTVLEPKILDLNEAVRDSEKMLRRLIGEHVQLNAVLDPSLEPVKVDPSQLSQVIINLTVNAQDAMPKGGTLTIETRNIELDQASAAQVPEAKPGRYVLLAMTDTGTGMTPEIRARIFEPFFTTKESGKGTGLGLPMVYGVVKQSGGFISVESQPQQGTAFRIFFPVAEGSIAQERPPLSVKPGPVGTETILLVEDEDAVRSMVRMALERAGYTVLEANRGREAIRVAAAHAGSIDLLITDVIMPEMGGPATADRLIEIMGAVPVLFMTGY
ncbi:MAG TPA: PAS domain-containing protein, partial [Candidatus Synoicihabitans sp.]|nr:PAS domain-containing protein [Candidatus Synoicihabitans sp.]